VWGADPITDPQDPISLGLELDPLARPVRPPDRPRPQASDAGTPGLRPPDARRCYQRELARQPDLHGRVTLRFTITPSGEVSELRVMENSSGSERLADCVRSVVQAHRFAPPTGGGPVVVTYPYVFVPSD
jgi:TonB family protein